ncbi:conserved hypothetical protein [Ricinus communis]|uniref:Biogenesis of lysosome-related organelles complex 1 subunit 7 n=1 Tax=Ricinus communis TaxID=3988 RepID=B9RI59_RICCO|nr:conserved hypothetical protein [Ricinus communis]
METPRVRCNSTDGMDSAVSDNDATEDNPKGEQSIPKNDIKKSSDALAKALSTMLGSIIRDFDSKAEDTFKSQDLLNSSIDRLTAELDKLLEDAPFPFIMQHAAKISAVRKRVSSLNFLLKSMQKRIDNIDRVLSLGLPQDSFGLFNE